MPMYDYRCLHCGEDFETLRPLEERLSATCPSCGAEAKFRISTPRIALDGTDPSFPGAYDSWDKKRRQKQKQEERKSYYDPN